MKRSILLSSATAWCCLGLFVPAFAAPPSATNLSGGDKTESAVQPAKTCLTDIKAFSDQMQKDGYWLGGSGYGYPLDGYGYGYGIAGRMAGHPPAVTNRYQNARSGYEIRTLIAAANILGQDGQQQTCEAVLATTRDIYKRYAADLHSKGMAMADGPDWQRQQVAAAVPVTDNKMAYRSDQLLGTDVRNLQDQGLGSVHDLVMDPRTGKIAYLIVARGGVFGFDRKYVPIP